MFAALSALPVSTAVKAEMVGNQSHDPKATTLGSLRQQNPAVNPDELVCRVQGAASASGVAVNEICFLKIAYQIPSHVDQKGNLVKANVDLVFSLIVNQPVDPNCDYTVEYLDGSGMALQLRADTPQFD